MAYFDPMYFLIVGPGLLLAMWATYKVKATFNKFQSVNIFSRMTGAEAARALLERNGIKDVKVELHQGFLSDHYHPVHKVVRLSPAVYEGRSISAVGVAAHEVGHAIQHAQKYGLMSVRQNLVTPANIGSYFSYFAIIVGVYLQSAGWIWAGIILFSFVVLFQLATLPVEFNASSRAKLKLVEAGITTEAEVGNVSKVLSAAAMTYVAALITSILNLLYFILRFAGGSRRR